MCARNLTEESVSDSAWSLQLTLANCQPRNTVTRTRKPKEWPVLKHQSRNTVLASCVSPDHCFRQVIATVAFGYQVAVAFLPLEHRVTENPVVRVRESGLPPQDANLVGPGDACRPARLRGRETSGDKPTQYSSLNMDSAVCI